MADDTTATAPPVRVALSIPNMAEPSTLVDLGRRVERAGWDGVFLWDHVHGSAQQPMPVADPWTVLGALAVQTERVRLGTSITPVARRRPHELARQVVTLDRLSGGRAVLGVGLGEPPEEYTSYGDPAERPVLAARLDEGLEVLDGLWTGEPFTHHGPHFTVEDAQYVPTARQEPRVPVWTSCVVQNRATLARAARWDGVVLAALGEGGSIDEVPVERVEAAAKAIAAQRSTDGPYDVAVTLPARPDDDQLATYRAAGATWIMVTGWIDQLDELVGQLD
jgi:alkanesulfonate monooxygenase SsuD/methylene tetrahydromethanopterin reductase-like flavin-dependent oxidoreductase (luciferase family)